MSEKLRSSLRECEKEIQQLKDKVDSLRKDGGPNPLRDYVSERKEEKSTDDRSLNLRNVRTLWKHPGKIYAIDWPAMYSTIVSVCQGAELSVWDTFKPRALMKISLRNPYDLAVAVNNSGDLTATGGRRSIISIYDTSPIKDDVSDSEPRDHEIGVDFTEHEGIIYDLQFIFNDERLISASGDGSLILWDMLRECPMDRLIRHSGDVTCVHFSDLNGLFLSGSIDGSCALWDYRAGHTSQCITQFRHHSGDVNDVRWMNDGRCFLSGSDDGTVQMIDIRCLRKLSTFENKSMGSESSSKMVINSVDSSLSGAYIMSGSDSDESCVVWDTLSGEIIQRLSHEAKVSKVRLSRDGTCFATACWDRYVRLWA